MFVHHRVLILVRISEVFRFKTATSSCLKELQGLAELSVRHGYQMSWPGQTRLNMYYVILSYISIYVCIVCICCFFYVVFVVSHVLLSPR